jgi:hypothetical protein
MAEIDNRTLALCIQALQRAIKFNDFLSQSETVDADDHEESSYQYEQELVRLIELYKQEVQAGRVAVPLAKLLHPPFDELLQQSCRFEFRDGEHAHSWELGATSTPAL